MYSSGYSQVNKYSPQTPKKRSKGKSCGYYMRIIFLFSSLIQSLIIVSLVLFVVYGKTQDSASETRIQDLEESFSQLSIDNVALRLQRTNLTILLNVTLTEKARNDFDLRELRRLCNISFTVIGNLEKKNQQCTQELNSLRIKSIFPPITGPPIGPGGGNCQPLFVEMTARYELLETNFTHTMQRMTVEMDRIIKERDNLNLETIRLRRDKSTQEKELEEYKKNSRQDISITFGQVKNVSRALREKIQSFFPRHIAFQLTCPKQREHLEQIHTNCTNLSHEVEDKLQRYLDTVSEQMSSIYFDNNHLKAENWRLNEDYRWCSQNRTATATQHRQSIKELQEKHDREKEQLLMDKMKLNGEKEVLVKQVQYKNTEVNHLTEKVRLLNMSCMLKPGGLGLQPNMNTGWNSLGGRSSATSFGQQGKIGLGSSVGSGLTSRNPGSTGTGSLASSYSSSGSTSILSNTGLGMNKPGSTGTGSLASSYSPSGSSSSVSNTGLGMNKPGSTGTGLLGPLFSPSGSSSSLSNTGLGMNKPGSTGTGSLASSYSSSGSSSSLSNTGLGMNKPGSTGTGLLGPLFSPSGSSSSLSNTGLGMNKPGSTGTGSLASSYSPSGSSSSLSNTGLGMNKPGSTGTGSLASSYSSSGSSSSLSNTGLGMNKPGSTGTGLLGPLFSPSGSSSSLSNTGLGMNKPGSTGGTSSSPGSAGSGSSLSSSGIGSNKPATNGKTSLWDGLGLSSASSTSSVSTSKTGSLSSGLSWLGLGTINPGQSKTGSTPGKPSSGSSNGGTGSYGGGQSSGSGSVLQHLQDLQRFINPPGPQEKQDLSRMLG